MKCLNVSLRLAIIGFCCLTAYPLQAALAPVESRNSNNGSSSSHSGSSGSGGAAIQPVSPPPVFSGTNRIATSQSNSDSSVSASSTSSTSTPGPAQSSSKYAMNAQDRAAHLTLSQIENLQREVGELRGLVETQEHTIKQLKKSQQDLYLDLERRLNQLQTTAQRSAVSSTNSTSSSSGTGAGTNASVGNAAVGAAVGASKTAVKGPASNANAAQPNKKNNSTASPSSGTGAEQPIKAARTEELVNSIEKTATDKTKTVTAKPQGDQETYQHAYSFVRSKKYPEAVSALQDYLNRFKKGEQAPQAHYWLGEVYMLQWQNDKNNIALLEKAENEFNNITVEYPNHPKTADALLKLGLIEIDKGNSDSATNYLSEVKSRYPSSAAARIADHKLQQLAAD